jgi:hypothetical protein
VRAQAVSALACLDFDLLHPGEGLKSETERLLVQRFYAEPGGRVRALIVAGFASESRSSPPVQKLITDAFQDSHPAVRHAAIDGTKNLDRFAAMALLAGALDDAVTNVRIQAAIRLSSFGANASDYLPRIEAALARESDARAQALLQRAIVVIRRGRP